MELIKMLTEYLFEKGYKVSFDGQRINLYFIKESHELSNDRSGRFVSRIICEIGPALHDKDIWGYYYNKPTAITVNGAATVTAEWYEIGNIHDPDFLDILIRKLDIELKIANYQTTTEWAELHNQLRQDTPADI
jgi:hypothetical protein